MATTDRIKPGSRVVMPGPWGVIGRVLEVYGPRGRRSALVRVPVDGTSGETLEEDDISVPLKDLRLVDAA